MSNTKRLIKAGGHALRAVLLMVAAAAVAVLVAWKSDPGAVDRLDERLFTSYVNSYTKRLDHAAALLGEGKTNEGKRVLEDLLEKMGAVRKQDRLARAYTAAVETLITLHNESGAIEKALELSRSLVEFDPNDYRFWTTRSALLEASGDTDGAVEAQKKAFDIAPQSLDVAERLTGILRRAGRAEEAAAAAREYMTAPRAGGAFLQLIRPGTDVAGVAASSLPSVAFTGRPQALEFTAAGERAVAVVVSFTEVMDLELTVTDLVVTTPEGTVHMNPYGAGYRTQEMARTGYNTFAVTGEKPALFIGLPPDLSGSALDAFTIKGIWRPRVSPAIRASLGDF